MCYNIMYITLIFLLVRAHLLRAPDQSDRVHRKAEKITKIILYIDTDSVQGFPKRCAS